MSRNDRSSSTWIIHWGGIGSSMYRWSSLDSRQPSDILLETTLSTLENVNTKHIGTIPSTIIDSHSWSLHSSTIEYIVTNTYINNRSFI